MRLILGVLFLCLNIHGAKAQKARIDTVIASFSYYFEDNIKYFDSVTLEIGYMKPIDVHSIYITIGDSNFNDIGLYNCNFELLRKGGAYFIGRQKVDKRKKIIYLTIHLKERHLTTINYLNLYYFDKKRLDYSERYIMKW
jgi:hypothetical protein